MSTAGDGALPTSASYVIAGGSTGRDRLRVLSAALEPTTTALLDRVGIGTRARCLDAGCGGGDVTVLIARRAVDGLVVATDRDPVKVELARAEAADLPNVEVRTEDVADTIRSGERFDLVVARFLLSHLADPAGALAGLAGLLAPGGVLAVEDVRVGASWCSPPSAAFDRSLRIYAETVRANGGNPELGGALPTLFRDAGLVDVGVDVVQPGGFAGPAKMIQLLTLTAIADAAVACGAASPEELRATVAELRDVVERADTYVTTAQVVQVWGRSIRSP